MKFYQNLFLGFYCIIKKILPNEEHAEAYAIGLMTGAASFLYFTLTILLMNRGASLWETAGVFFVLYGLHHFLFANKKIGEKAECSAKWIYRSLLFFFTALSFLMFAATQLA